MSDQVDRMLKHPLSRRQVMQAGLFGGAAAFLAACSNSTASSPPSTTSAPASVPPSGALPSESAAAGLPDISGQEIFWPGYGGPYDEAIKNTVDPLFQQATGCKVTVVSGPDSAKLTEMVRNDAVEWDLWPSGPEFPPSIFEDPNTVFEAIDYTIVHADPIPKDLQFKYMITTDGYSLGIVWRKDKFPQGLTSWADVWDTTNFPGKRSLPRRAADIVEIAAMASGVAADDPNFYPIDIDRALAAIGQIQPDVTKFWTGGEEPMQLLLSGEVDIAGVWLSRVFTPISQDAPIDFTWNQNIFRIGGFSPVKGTKHLDAVQQYLDWRCKPEMQALISNVAAIAYTNPDTAQFITPGRESQLPSSPANIEVQHLSEGKFWFDNESSIDKQLTDILGVG